MPGTTRLYLITDRSALGPDPHARSLLVAMVRDASRAGVEMIQIRERGLTARDLFRLVRDAVEAARGTSTQIFVNDRFDVALAAGADGVHLTTRSIGVASVRAAVGGRLVVGASTHSGAEVRAATEAGADFVVLGPVYDTPSKRGMGDPLGLESFAAIAAHARIPVFALGGIDLANAGAAAAAGAGIAAIRMFQGAWTAGRLEALVDELARHADPAQGGNRTSDEA